MQTERDLLTGCETVLCYKQEAGPADINCKRGNTMCVHLNWYLLKLPNLHEASKLAICIDQTDIFRFEVKLYHTLVPRDRNVRYAYMVSSSSSDFKGLVCLEIKYVYCALRALIL